MRLYIDGDVDSMTPEEPPQGQNVEFRTSFTVAIEGYDIDLDYKIYPALWQILLRQGSADPTALDSAFDFTGTFDLRENPANPTVDYRQETTVMPPEGTCAAELRRERFAAYQVHEIQFNSLVVQPVPNTAATPPGFPAASGVTAFGQGTISAIGNYVDDGTHEEAITQGGGFYAGTYALVVVESGSYTESSTQSGGFYAGTYV